MSVPTPYDRRMILLEIESQGEFAAETHTTEAAFTDFVKMVMNQTPDLGYVHPDWDYLTIPKAEIEAALWVGWRKKRAKLAGVGTVTR